MPDYAFEGPHWANTTITWAVNGSVSPALVPTIAAAFSDWAAVSTLHFQQIDYSGAANIQIGEAALDGANGRLGVTNYAFSGSSTFSANILFDSGESWHATDAGTILSDGGANLRITAEHEIGHALGLGHYDGGPAVMNTILTAAVVGLTASDVHGIQALYGAPAPSASDADTANVARLYYGVLGRAPDAGGLAAWTNAVAHGISLHDVAAGMLASTEYRGVSTGYTDPGFVAALYGQVLGRAGDAGGMANWTDYLAHGGARGAVIDGFTSSAEFQGHYAGQSSRDYVEGLYEHVLNRTGDTDGLNNWAAQLDGRTMSRVQVAGAFTGSAEFQQKYVAPSNAAFVDGLYVNALGRHADAGGLASWVDQLAHGTSRADVAVGIAESPEAQQHHLADLEQGWHLS